MTFSINWFTVKVDTHLGASWTRITFSTIKTAETLKKTGWKRRTKNIRTQGLGRDLDSTLHCFIKKNMSLILCC